MLHSHSCCCTEANISSIFCVIVLNKSSRAPVWKRDQMTHFYISFRSAKALTGSQDATFETRLIGLTWVLTCSSTLHVLPVTWHQRGVCVTVSHAVGIKIYIYPRVFLLLHLSTEGSPPLYPSLMCKHPETWREGEGKEWQGGEGRGGVAAMSSRHMAALGLSFTRWVLHRNPCLWIKGRKLACVKSTRCAGTMYPYTVGKKGGTV